MNNPPSEPTTAISFARPGQLLRPDQSDWEAAEAWLRALATRTPPASPHTLANYRREIHRVRWYCEHFGRPSLRHWGIEDATEYLTFLREQAGKWVSTRRQGEGTTPFRSPPSTTSIANTQRVLHALFSFWQKARYIDAHPFVGIGSGGRALRTVEPHRRAVPPSIHTLVLQTMAEAPRSRDQNYLALARDRFLLRLLDLTGAREQEVAAADMADIEPVFHAPSGRMYWSFVIRHGKGGKARRVPVPPQLLAEFQAYRTAFGLPPTPERGETLPLLLSTRTDAAVNAHGDARERRYLGQWKGIRRRATVWDIVKARFRAAATYLREQGRRDEAAFLEAASPHWMRHSTATNLLRQGVAPRVAAEIMGHADLRTIMGYSHAEFLAVVEELEEKGYFGEPSTTQNDSD